MSEIEEVFKA